MKYEVQGTRAFYEAAPQFKSINHAHIAAPDFAINCKTYHDDCSTVNPDSEALEFYALNHLAAVVRKSFTLHEKLPTWADRVLAEYLDCLSKQGVRLFYYTVLVTTRESRHVKNLHSSNLQTPFIEKFGQSCYDFGLSIRGSSSDGAVSKFFSHPPKSPLGPYLNGLFHIFDEGSFGGGYGGKPWANIAKTVASFTDGLTSMEMMVDTAYTLAHNNGPMFNKGMMYDMYSHRIYRVLDVQRSGQIPEMVLYDKSVSGLASSTITELCKTVKKECPNEIGDYLDWVKVKALGALKEYPSEIAAQLKEHAVKPKPKSIPGFKVTEKTWSVFPKQHITILERA